MNALVPVSCANPAQIAAKTALLRRIEAASRANEDRQEPPRHGYGHARPAATAQNAHPISAVAAHILGACQVYPDVSGYRAYEKASRLLALESHAIDVTLS